MPPNHGSIEPDTIPMAGQPEMPARQKADPPACACFERRGRNLVVCIDGTANQFSAKVGFLKASRSCHDLLNIHRRIPTGIGTYVRGSKFSPTRWMQALDHNIDMAIAWHFKRIVLSAYQWLSENYEDGDRIFLFGFSRGAYQARVIAGMIEWGVPKVGLLHKGNNEQIAFAYELYMAITAMQTRASTSGKSPNSTATTPALAGEPSPMELSARFKSTLSRRNVKVHFVGAWDTVSSIGFARGKSLPETTTGMSHVCVFRHALALDERRVKFLPEYANGGAGPKEARSNIKEVWFAGSHSDIGGGNASNLGLDKFGPSLRWMTNEATISGLLVEDFRGEWQLVGKPTKSMNWFWLIMECLPFTRLSYNPVRSDVEAHTTNRRVMDGQLIHESVFLPDPQTFRRPAARLPSQITWDAIATDVSKERIEPDPYTSTGDVIQDILQGERSAYNRRVLMTLVSSETGRNIIERDTDVAQLFKALDFIRTRDDIEAEERKACLANCLLALGAFRSLPADDAVQEWTLATANLLYHDDNQQIRQAFDEHDVHQAVYQIRALFQDAVRKIMDALTGGEPMSDLERRVLAMLWTSDSGKEVITRCSDVNTLFNTLSVVQNDVSMTVESRKHRSTDLAIALSAFDPSAYAAEKDREFAKCLPDIDTQRPGIGSELLRFISLRLAQHLVAKLERLDPDHDMLEVLLSSGRESIRDATDISRLLESLAAGRSNKAMPLETWQIYVTDVAFVLGTFSSLPSSVCPYRNSDLTDLFSDADVQRPGVRENMDRIRQIFGDRLLKAVEGHTNIVCSVSFSADGSQIASGSGDNTIRIWNADTGKEVREPLRGHTSYVNSVSFSPDGKRLASASTDGTVRLWDVETGQRIGQPLEEHTNWVCCVAFSPDGNRIVSGSVDRTLRLWDAHTGQAIGEPFRGHSDYVQSVAFSPDGKHIASGSSDSTIRLWDAETGEPVGEPLQGHNSSVFSVAYSPDGTRIVSGSYDKTIRIWDTQTRQTVVGPLQGHKKDVNSVAFSPDGKHVVSGSEDGTMRIWDTQTGQTVAGPWEAHGGEYGVRSVAFSPNGKRLVSGGYDNMVKIWDGEVD
ncbi:hypothetical protein PUNSTDRAFT_139337 [Punctularia strigosozonata HHB-11173 SS5]|uniref:Uncharacterized protein n=1 Tax=Punctularia strigosozonata (strain HHB-11173) TaxID=741275 RepID=R7S2Y6_PUNST|nr:uncharacterized protein PUNSTDRAFT_139337 [Punctularia strigosozonata HHB-11173 SS5]EIN03616.1 hypothetical protein PUNSTDRAFT_139337 [Punctularia strigosozonata HHB-11173 SS5]